MTYLIFILYAFIGFVFTVILMDDLLIGYKRYLVSSKVIPEWLKKPLGLCSVCFTGQLSLWGMLPLVVWNYEGIVLWIGTVALNMIIVLILTHHYAEKN